MRRIELPVGDSCLPVEAVGINWGRSRHRADIHNLRTHSTHGIVREDPEPKPGWIIVRGELESEGTLDTGYAIKQTKRFVEAGAYMIQIESEGITENADPWRTDVPAEFINEIGLEKLMFEAADPEVFAWYIKNYGPEVNVFVDHSQIVQLETLRRGIWGTKSLWGRVLTYKG